MAINDTKYSREFVGELANAVSIDSLHLTNNFDRTVEKVESMLAKQSIYSTWVRFQFGKNTTQPVIFNSASNDIQENIIASLEFEKSGAGISNSFTLSVIWDPFNYGQNPSDKLQALDDMIAEALEFDQYDNIEALLGYIQYGYNYTEDNYLVSPVYEFILTNASSKIDWKTGITTYTFEGTTTIGLDCDFNKITYEAVHNWNLMDLVGWILYYYYGDPENPPPFQDIDTSKPIYPNSPKYKIDIPQRLYEICGNVSTETITGDLNPWNYCLQIMNAEQNGMTDIDRNSGKYNDWENLKTSQKPSYTMYITDRDGEKIIHVTHLSPLISADEDVTNEEGYSMMSNKIFTWGVQKSASDTTPMNSLVVGWSSSIDLNLYLVQRVCKARQKGQELYAARQEYDKAQQNYSSAVAEYNQQQEEQSEIISTTTTRKYQRDWEFSGRVNTITGTGQGVTIGQQKAAQEKVVEATKTLETATAKLKEVEDSYLTQSMVDEYFDAELQLVGIPADIPINMQVKIKPRILESVPSRQAGVYTTTGATDFISTDGTYVTKIKLFKLRNLEDDASAYSTSKSIGQDIDTAEDIDTSQERSSVPSVGDRITKYSSGEGYGGGMTGGRSVAGSGGRSVVGGR